MSREPGFQVTGEAAERYAATSYPFMSPFVAALAQYVHTGDAVLDVACGTGYATEVAGDRAGDKGTVTGVDVNPGMVQVATLHAKGRYEIHLAPADRLPFPDAGFDVVLCQQGLQFFPDIRAAFDEAVRVLRPGGRFAATFWAAREKSPYMGALLKGHSDVLGYSPPQDQVFTSEPAKFVAAATEAGLIGVTVEEVVAEVALPSLPAYAEAHLGALPWAAGLDAETRKDIAKAATAELHAYHTPDGGARVPFVSHLLQGRSRP